MYLSPALLLDYWDIVEMIEHITIVLFYVKPVLVTNIFAMGGPVLAINCPCDIWHCTFCIAENMLSLPLIMFMYQHIS